MFPLCIETWYLISLTLKHILTPWLRMSSHSQQVTSKASDVAVMELI